MPQPHVIPELSVDKPEFMQMECKSIDMEKRTIDCVMTTSGKDREGDIVEPSGLDFKNFMKNPVVLWAHDMNIPPIGKVIRVNPGTRSVSATVQFADTPFALEVFKLYAGGYLNAWSIGFLPKKWDRITSDDTHPATPGEPNGFRILKAELIELSAVPVPANADALSKALELSTSEEIRKALQEEKESESLDSALEEGWIVSSVERIKASPLYLPEDAFRKTISDRAKGRFPIVFEPIGENGPEVIVEYEHIQREKGLLIEAKLVSVKLAVLAPAADAPATDGEGREAQEEDSTPDSGRPQDGTPAPHQMEEDVAEAHARLAMLDAELFDLNLEEN